MERVLLDIWLREEVRLTTHRILEARRHFGSAEAICRSLKNGEKGFFTQEEQERAKKASMDRPQRILESCKRQGVRALSFEDADYPAPLKEIYDPPAVLYLRGTLPQWQSQPALAIVGRRKAGPLGLETARRFAHVLSAHGFVIVSGLAYGIDGAAHRGALEGPTPTVAVLGTAIDQCYPASHNGLMRQILKEGAVLSEYPPGARGYPGYFPRRNRIISGLCLGVLVVEAAKKSGAIITASSALEQGRDVFAVPGSIDRPEYEGSNALIRAGAALCTDPVEICQEYAGRFPGLVAGLTEEKPPEEPQKKLPLHNLTTRERQIVESIEGRTHIDQICQRVELGAGEVLTSLTMLEIKGIVRECGAKYFEIL